MACLLFLSPPSWRCCAQNDSKPATSTSHSCPTAPTSHYTISRRQFSTLAAAVSLTQIVSRPDTSNACAQCEAQPEGFKESLDSQFASWMENGMVGYEKNIKQRKQNLFSLIPPGSVIADVGIGTGPNLSLMPPNSTIIGIEPNPYMWPYVKDKAREYNNLASLKLLDATCENMPLVDTASCDAAITTLTLCSIPDVIGGLHEIKRVLKPGGVFLFVEHVIAEPTRPVLRFAQKVLTPVQKALADGCHLDRDSESLIVAAMGDSAEEIQIERFDAVFGSAIENAISPLRPHISGFVRLKKGV